jgi:hypothetical protein
MIMLDDEFGKENAIGLKNCEEKLRESFREIL